MWTGENAYRYDRSGVTATGGTRWAEPAEVKTVLTQVDMTKETIPGCGAPLISDGCTAYVNNGDSHTLIIGSTGSKKTRLVIMPTLETIARAGESVICTDPKGELYERTSGMFAEKGYELRVFNLREPLRSHGWSVLHDAVQAYA